MEEERARGSLNLIEVFLKKISQRRENCFIIVLNLI